MAQKDEVNDMVQPSEEQEEQQSLVQGCNCHLVKEEID
jgi:hypothetical protein